jgi:hypothetical protein
MLDAEFITALVELPEFEIIDGIIREDGSVSLIVNQNCDVGEVSRMF